jgi:HEPN domain-containing protein
LSGEYVNKLKRRAKAFLREALSVEEPDLAVFFVEQAMQLYAKAVCFELFGELVRGHKVRGLLAVLIKMLEERGFKNVADKLLEFVDKNRRVLVTAEEAYTMSRP